jgi:quercetin dioxygenase-like cupin family protein
MITINPGRVDVNDAPAIIFRILPQQGSIEVQKDAPGKLHDWHKHDTDETLIIVAGAVRFFWEGGERNCQPGDLINLPAGELHGSQALEDGSIYLIALQRLDLA